MGTGQVNESRREFKHLASPLPMACHPIACGHPQPCAVAAARSREPGPGEQVEAAGREKSEEDQGTETKAEGYGGPWVWGEVGTGVGTAGVDSRR